jgi:Ca2+-binding RTX toxin-like protein
MRARRAALIAIVIGAGVALVAPAASAKPGDIYVGDPGTPGVVRVDSTTAVPQLFSSASTMDCPDGSTFGPDGTLYVADYCANGGDGAIFKVDRAGAVSLLAEDDAVMAGPTDVAYGPDGFLYVADPFAGTGSDGLIFRVDPRTGAVSSISDAPQFAGGPLGIDVLPDGTLLVADQDAGPANSGAVFRIDPVSGVATVLAQGGLLDGPYHLELAPGLRSAIVGDSTGRVLRVDVLTGAVSSVSETPAIGSLAAAEAPSGTVYATGNDDTIYTAVGGGLIPFAAGSPLDFPEGLQIEPPTCGGKTATIVGSSSGDKINGSRFADVIATLGGKDRVNGGPGNDIVCGGAGKDILKGGAGKDVLRGEAGKDKLVGGKGKDRMLGGKGNDACAGKGDKTKSC